MWNNTKGEQDNLCLALINPRLCKKLSIKVAVEQHDTKTAVPYGITVMLERLSLK